MKSKRLAACLITWIVVSMSGCATARKVPPSGEGTPQSQGAPAGSPAAPNEVYGPPEPPAQPVYGPEPIQLRPLILVLGPGGARGYAYVGALRAIAEAKIPVAAVYGTEMGALFGTLYAMSGSISQFEWSLLKFPDDVFVQQKSLIPNPFGGSADGKRFESALSKAFGNKDLRTSKIPVRVALRLRDKDRPVAISEGLARDALRAAVASPGMFDPGHWEGQLADSAGKERPFLVSEARATGLGSVVVIDASGDPRISQLPELKDADFVLRPDVRGIGPLDFSKKTEAAFKGKTEVNQHLAELRHLAGMPNEGPSP